MHYYLIIWIFSEYFVSLCSYIKIRNEISKTYGQNVAERVIIQYGGSVKSTNSEELFSMPDIDGGLVGGASLNAEEFSKIANWNN